MFEAKIIIIHNQPRVFVVKWYSSIFIISYKALKMGFLGTQKTGFFSMTPLACGTMAHTCPPVFGELILVLELFYAFLLFVLVLQEMWSCVGNSHSPPLCWSHIFYQKNYPRPFVPYITNDEKRVGGVISFSPFWRWLVGVNHTRPV